VVLDQNPDHALAADLKARVEADRGAQDGAACANVSV